MRFLVGGQKVHRERVGQARVVDDLIVRAPHHDQVLVAIPFFENLRRVVAWPLPDSAP